MLVLLAHAGARSVPDQPGEERKGANCAKRSAPARRSRPGSVDHDFVPPRRLGYDVGLTSRRRAAPAWTTVGNFVLEVPLDVAGHHGGYFQQGVPSNKIDVIGRRDHRGRCSCRNRQRENCRRCPRSMLIVAGRSSCSRRSSSLHLRGRAECRRRGRRSTEYPSNVVVALRVAVSAEVFARRLELPVGRIVARRRPTWPRTRLGSAGRALQLQSAIRSLHELELVVVRARASRRALLRDVNVPIGLHGRARPNLPAAPGSRKIPEVSSASSQSSTSSTFAAVIRAHAAGLALHQPVTRSNT